MGRRSESGGVEAKGERIQITFAWRGRRLRPTLNLKPNAANLRAAKRIRDSILDDIREGKFDLSKYFPDYAPPKEVVAPAGNAPTLKRAGELWLKSLEVAHSTKVNYGNILRHYWYPALGDKLIRRVSFEDIVDTIDEHVESTDDTDGISAKTRNNILTPLRGAFSVAVVQRWIDLNPALLIKSSRLQRPEPDPFSLEEVEVILTTFRKGLFGEALADYFEFAFFAGLRTSEQIALLWRDVDMRKLSLRVHHTRTMGREESRTKTYVERTVELNARAAAALKRQEARTRLGDTHVFVNPTTGAEWNRSNVVRDYWADTLKRTRIRYRPPKETRDTSVSLALMAGADPQYVAAQHGHSLTVMMKNYAKWIPGGDADRNRARINEALGFATGMPPNSASSK